LGKAYTYLRHAVRRMASVLLKLKAMFIAVMACFMIFVNDHLPQFIRRKLLSKEYSGQGLEDRLAVQIFAGWSTVKAIYHMLTINMTPQLQVGQQVSELKVLQLSSLARVPITSLSTSSSRPLVLNFGSCT